MQLSSFTASSDAIGRHHLHSSGGASTNAYHPYQDSVSNESDEGGYEPTPNNIVEPNLHFAATTTSTASYFHGYNAEPGDVYNGHPIASPTTTSDDDGNSQWSYTNSPIAPGSSPVGQPQGAAGAGNDQLALNPTVSAQIVLQALRNTGQALGISYEHLRRHGQQAVTLALAAGAASGPMATLVGSPVGVPLTPGADFSPNGSASGSVGSGTEIPGAKRRKINESEHQLIKNYQILEEGKKNELKVIQDRVCFDFGILFSVL